MTLVTGGTTPGTWRLICTFLYCNGSPGSINYGPGDFYTWGPACIRPGSWTFLDSGSGHPGTSYGNCGYAIEYTYDYLGEVDFMYHNTSGVTTRFVDSNIAYAGSTNSVCGYDLISVAKGVNVHVTSAGC